MELNGEVTRPSSIHPLHSVAAPARTRWTIGASCACAAKDETARSGTFHRFGEAILQRMRASSGSGALSRPNRRHMGVFSKPCSAGFTLVELAVVLFILSVAFAILLPRLPRLTGTERTTAVRRLALALQADHEEAAIKKKALR